MKNYEEKIRDVVANSEKEWISPVVKLRKRSSFD